MTLEISAAIAGNTATITLAGELDSASAADFKAAIEKVAAERPAKLVLMVRDLAFMASAGLRVLIFAKQRLDPAVNIYVVQPQEPVLDTLQKTGFDRSVFVVDAIPA